MHKKGYSTGHYTDPTSSHSLNGSLMSTLVYFSLFRHPLTFVELSAYCHFCKATNAEISKSLEELIEQKAVCYQDGYYFLNDSGPSTVKRRQHGERMMPSYLKKARKYSQLISCFPFVRGVFVSGSLSKGYMDEHSDIDYFIITSHGRLWICRTMLILFKKIFLLNSHKHFCLNYFIDDANLRIPDRNIFTATELVFVLPMYNSSIYRHFRKANQWTYQYYPNLLNEGRKVMYEFRNNSLRNLAERLLSGRAGEFLDTLCFRKTLKYWKNKFRDFDESAFDMELRSKKTVSKHHPRGFQSKVLRMYEDKITETEKSSGIKIRLRETVLQEEPALSIVN